MNISFIKVIILLILSSYSFTGFQVREGNNDKFNHFKYGITFEECKKQLANYDIEYNDENRSIEIANYMSLNGKQVSLFLAFSSELKFGDTMETLDDSRLILYAFGMVGVDHNYTKRVVEDFCKLYGEPTNNNFFDATNNDENYADWSLDNTKISIYYHTNLENRAKSFTNVSFRLSDKEREKFKQYIK